MPHGRWLSLPVLQRIGTWLAAPALWWQIAPGITAALTGPVDLKRYFGGRTLFLLCRPSPLKESKTGTGATRKTGQVLLSCPDTT